MHWGVYAVVKVNRYILKRIMKILAASSEQKAIANIYIAWISLFSMCIFQNVLSLNVVYLISCLFMLKESPSTCFEHTYIQDKYAFVADKKKGAEWEIQSLWINALYSLEKEITWKNITFKVNFVLCIHQWWHYCDPAVMSCEKSYGIMQQPWN